MSVHTWLLPRGDTGAMAASDGSANEPAAAGGSSAGPRGTSGGVAPGRQSHAVWSAWVFTGALLVIVMGSVMLVNTLHDRSDAQQQAQAMAGELEQDAAELRVAVDALMSSKRFFEVRVEIGDELADLKATSATLREMGDAAVTAAIERDLGALAAAVRSQLESLQAGEQEVGEKRTEAALDAFDDRVEVASDYYAVAADRSARVSEMGLWVAVLVAGLAISGLSWRYERARRATREVLEERLRERVAEVAAITERHRQLEALKYSFVTAVSHELRTPLTAIYGSLEMLEDGDAGPLSPGVARVVAVASRGTRRLSRLVEDIIDLERLESGRFGFHPAPHDLHALLLETVESLASLTERAGVELVLDQTHADVLCDGDRVLQALTNLVGNAIKFTSPGGSIHLGAVRGAVEVEVTVRDDGRGIPADQLNAVFDHFHQVDPEADQAKGGAGLGLTITRHIIEAHGGRIWVESEYGTGTAFRFTLPLALPQPHEPESIAEMRAESEIV